MNKSLQKFTIGLNIKELLLLVFLISASGFSTFIQLISLFVFSIAFIFVSSKIKFVGRWIFYVFLLILTLIQLLFLWRADYGLNFLLNTFLISLMWFLALQCSNIVIASIFSFNNFKVERVLKLFFKLNLILVILQIVVMCIEMKTLFPFSNMSAGDNLKGFFRNSSVNMIIMSFYLVFYLYNKEYRNMLIAAFLMVLTFYMSGLLIFVGVFAVFVFLTFSFKVKLKVIGGLLIGLFLFAKFSPENVVYVEHILTKKIDSRTDPARKIVSFSQTYQYWVDSPSQFIFGAGGGKFSSRSAFITGGEYVGWFPENLIYRSSEFENNHFALWNKEILSKPYKDGTSNQPFSFYNKIIGEYGLIGLILFLLYLFSPLKYYKKMSYGKLILPLMIVYFLLDYWFEYFSVIVFLELFLYLDIKKQIIVNNDN